MKTSKTKGRRPKWSGLPPKQGLYDPAFEHDACGVGFVVDIKGRKSHKILQQGLQVLTNLDHRGACGAEVNTGDGAGVLLQMPHKFLVEACKKDGIDLPNPGEYGCGIVFLPRNPTVRRRIEERFEQIVQSEGQTVLGWRTVPTNNSTLGDTAKSCEPFMRQVFIGRNPEIKDELAFERKLYVIRKRAYSEIRTSTMEGAASWYVASLSHKTLVYKGMLLTQQLAEYFPDLSRSRDGNGARAGALALQHEHVSRAGIARIRIATSRTTAKSTRFAATPTGCMRARRCSIPKRSATTSTRSCRSSIRTAPTRRCSTTRSSCSCSPAARCRTP